MLELLGACLCDKVLGIRVTHLLSPDGHVTVQKCFWMSLMKENTAEILLSQDCKIDKR